MADRDDPNLSAAPLSEANSTPLAAASDDPLVELVRMVSDRWVFDLAPVRRRKTVPVTRAVRADVAAVKDLEAKLFDDLNALSAAFHSHPAPTPSMASEEPISAAPKPAAAAPPAMNGSNRSLALNLKNEPGQKVLYRPQPTTPPAPAPVAPPLPTVPAPAVLPPRAKRQAPAADPTGRSPVTRATGATARMR
jgi:hypothetical protein